MPRRSADDRGQSIVELIALIPILALVLVAAGQLFLYGYTMNETSNAAWAAARAGSVGDDCDQAARASLGALSNNLASSVPCGGPVYTVTVNTPRILPGLSDAVLQVTRKASVPNLRN